MIRIPEELKVTGPLHGKRSSRGETVTKGKEIVLNLADGALVWWNQVRFQGEVDEDAEEGRQDGEEDFTDLPSVPPEAQPLSRARALEQLGQVSRLLTEVLEQDNDLSPDEQKRVVLIARLIDEIPRSVRKQLGGDIQLSVKAIARNASGQHLVLKDAGTDFWDLPGGHVQEGETPRKALRREVKEETNLVIMKARERAIHVLKLGDEVKPVLFYDTVVSGKVKLSDEHEGYIWAPQRVLKVLNLGVFKAILLPSGEDTSVMRPAGAPAGGGSFPMHQMIAKGQFPSTDAAVDAIEESHGDPVEVTERRDDGDLVVSCLSHDNEWYVTNDGRVYEYWHPEEAQTDKGMGEGDDLTNQRYQASKKNIPWMDEEDDEEVDKGAYGSTHTVAAKSHDEDESVDKGALVTGDDEDGGGSGNDRGPQGHDVAEIFNEKENKDGPPAVPRQRAGEGRDLRMRSKQGPPGPPPREGLTWNPATHRWRSSDAMREEEHSGYNAPSGPEIEVQRSVQDSLDEIRTAVSSGTPEQFIEKIKSARRLLGMLGAQGWNDARQATRWLSEALEGIGEGDFGKFVMAYDAARQEVLHPVAKTSTLKDIGGAGDSVVGADVHTPTGGGSARRRKNKVSLAKFVAQSTQVDSRYVLKMGDSAQVLKELPADSVDVVVSSPSYFGDKMSVAAGELGSGSSSEYIGVLKAVFGEVHRVLKDTGSMWIVSGDGGGSVELPRLVTRTLIENGWYHQKTYGWAKGDVLDSIIHVTKRKTGYYGEEVLKAHPPADVWSFNLQDRHQPGSKFGAFPLGLAETAITLTSPPEGVVLDPFVGTGTTVLAAVQNRRKGIGVDISGNELQVAKRRLELALHKGIKLVKGLPGDPTPYDLRVVYKQVTGAPSKNRYIVAGYASPVVVDLEGHRINHQALGGDVDRFLAETSMGSFANLNVMHCLAPETEVLVERGGPGKRKTFKPIVDIREGDRVYTHKGRKQVVNQVAKFWKDEQLVELHLANGVVVQITDDHEVLTTDGWVEAGALTLDHVLHHARPRRSQSESQKRRVRVAMLGREITWDVGASGFRTGAAARATAEQRRGRTWAEVYGEVKARAKSLKHKLQRGPLHPNWRGGVSGGEYPYNWQEIRKEILVRDGYVCVRCGITDGEVRQNGDKRGLHVDHIDSVKSHSQPTNLQLLCPSCHAKKTRVDDRLVRELVLANGTKIDAIERVAYRGWTYCLNVGEDHSYVGNGIVYHNSNVTVGKILPEFTLDDGSVLKTQVDERGLFVVAEVRTDPAAPEICKYVIKDIESGKLRSFSISGNADDPVFKCDGERCFYDISQLQLYEITLCEEGVNPGAKLAVISKELRPIQRRALV